MNKQFIKLILKTLLLVIILWGIFAFFIHNFQMYIYDGEYASYKESLDYIKNTNEYNDVIICGDSVAKSAIIPTEISDKTYTIAMPGTSAIEQYYFIEDYLENHEKPKTIIMMYSMTGYSQDIIDRFFWNRSIYFNCITNEQFFEIMKTGLFPEPMKAIWNYFQYKTYMPTKYYAALKNSIEQRRYETNIDRYDYNREHKGQQYFGIEKENVPNNADISNMTEFKVLPIIDYYLNKSIELCKENDIQFILLQNPINFSTYTNSKDKFRIEFTEYMENLEEKHEGIIVDPNITVADNSWFGDFVHLNPHGATQFTTQIKEKYPEYLYITK